jgi:hypothetical protein
LVPFSCGQAKPKGACQADGDSLQARHDWQEALTTYDAIGAPEAEEIRARLVMEGADGNDVPEPG